MNRSRKERQVVASWSGGIDSTGVVAQLCTRGYDVIAVTSDLYDKRMPHYANREARARLKLLPRLEHVAAQRGGSLRCEKMVSQCVWDFAIPNTLEVPNRNKRWLDLLMAQYVMPLNIMNVAMGEYIGVDTWVVRDHVPPGDCDDRALSAYLLHEYGIKYRFISLADFGESRYKSDRVELGFQILNGDICLTSNCMRDSEEDCGSCYKCIERAAAFHVAGLPDTTRYMNDPRIQSMHFNTYCRQMQGEDVSLPHAAF